MRSRSSETRVGASTPRTIVILFVSVLHLALQIVSVHSLSAPNILRIADQKQQNETTRPDPQQVATASQDANCTAACTLAEFSSIIQRLNQNDDVISSFLQGKPTRGKNEQQPPVRAECVIELVGLIRNLASDELEMKSALEFASGTSPLPRGGAQLTSSRRQSSSSLAPSCRRSVPVSSASSSQSAASSHEEKLLVGPQEPEASAIETTKSKVLPKVVARVDHYIDSLERFTLTREWGSLMKVFQGVESIMSLFVQNNTTSGKLVPSKTPVIEPSVSNYSKRVATTTEAPTRVNSSDAAKKTQVVAVTSLNDETVESLKQTLPNEVQMLTNSLGNLFPWHVWPWNNADLYSTAETFLNHGVFAFSKTTSGPERRIDYLADMLQTLFKSMKHDSFPKKCSDWSKVICEPEKFHERLVLGGDPSAAVSELPSASQHQWKVDTSKGKNLTGELTCIMFSSLSMKQFGASANDLQGQEEAASWASLSASQSMNQQRLAWDRLVHKALKLYSLAREALTDEQWNSLYKLLNDLWVQQKVSDRVIMVGRVVQLLTNCHMPKEMLESALWKDIYKYKNALNQMSDIVIEELNRSSENGKFSVDQLALGSRNLNEILVRIFKLLPKLIESLSKTIVDQLPDLVNKFFWDKVAFYQGPCKGSSLSELIPNLDAHRAEIMELEDLICAQLNTKPNFSMMQINNLTNELLAMAFNFSNFGNAFALPEFFSQFSPVPLLPPANATVSTGGSTLPGKEINVTSIVDELVANPRLAAIVAILQSSPLDPPEVHAELPELDWVEASTSVALFYESIQRLMSFEGQFVIFPEVEGFQDSLMSSADKGRQLFKKFSRRDPIRLLAYALDTVMPIALRTFKPMDSFYLECQATLRDLFSQVPDAGSGSSASQHEDQTSQLLTGPNGTSNTKESRQWQCFISSLNFGAHALNRLIANFNSMLENVLAQASFLATSADVMPTTTSVSSNRTTEGSCLLFDGSLARLLDNWPQVMELALESVLVTSTQSFTESGLPQVSLYETVCDTNYSLDPFSSTSQEDLRSTKVAMCRLASKTTLTNCAHVLKLDDWKSTMHYLNATWFETSAVSVEPAFRATTKRVHEFLVLFGRAKPNNWSESLLARILNVNSFWDSLLNKTVHTVERYQDRKFELGLQTLEPIVYENLLSASASNASDLDRDTRDALVTSIASANALITHFNSSRYKTSEELYGPNGTTEAKIARLFALIDEHAYVTVETLLRTLATNVSRLEMLFESRTASPIAISTVWSRFCGAPLDKYLVLGNETSAEQRVKIAQDDLCRFGWLQLKEQLVTSLGGRLSDYPVKQLTRVALTKWGQTFDALVALVNSRPERAPKFMQVQYWSTFHANLAQITPLKDQPSNFIWIWEGIGKLVAAAESVGAAGGAARSSKLSEGLVRALDQLNCALDSVKGGLAWDNLANIYSDRQEILAAHSTINNGFVLASIGVSTFMAPKKFQRLLDEFVRPIQRNVALQTVGANSTGSGVSFCEMRDKSKWESILSLPNEAVDFSAAIGSFQELVCDTNFETLPLSINPISVCYQYQAPSTNSSGASSLPETIDRAFKLTSLAIMDSKLVAANDARPPILDKSQWASFWDWWSMQPAAEPRGGLALALVRVFQTLDSMNSGHVIWRAVFKSVHEVSEALAFLVRASEQRRQVMVNDTTVTTISSNQTSGSSQASKSLQSQQLMSTVSSLLFPEASNLIPLKTFKQLRYVKSIADYFTSTPGVQESVCSSLQSLDGNTTLSSRASRDDVASRVELIGFRLNTSANLNLLLCHYHSSQWLTALNIVISAKTSSLTKRVNYMTKYLSTFAKQYKDYEQLESFIHARQMDNIEQVSNATISHLLVASYSLRGSMSLSKLSNVSWSSLPSILNSVDRQLCDNSQAEFGIHNFKQLINFYGNNQNSNQSIGNLTEQQLKPFSDLARALDFKRPSDLEDLICKLPQWNLIQQLPLRDKQDVASADSKSNCATPFKLAARWIQFAQDAHSHFKTRSSKDRIKKCLTNGAGSKKGSSKSVSEQSLRFIRYLNKMLNAINSLTSGNSWTKVRSTWTSISYHLVSNNGTSIPSTRNAQQTLRSPLLRV